MSRDNEVQIEDAECVRETDKALLVQVDGLEVWIPKSQLRDGTELKERGDVGLLVIPEWLAEEKGLA